MLKEYDLFSLLFLNLKNKLSTSLDFVCVYENGDLIERGLQATVFSNTTTIYRGEKHFPNKPEQNL